MFSDVNGEICHERLQKFHKKLIEMVRVGIFYILLLALIIILTECFSLCAQQKSETEETLIKQIKHFREKSVLKV